MSSNYSSPRDPLRGAAGRSFLEERAARNRADETPCCTVALLLRVVCPCGRAMSGIVKVIVSFLFRGAGP